jgi:uncharacterized membrane protein (DUF485 family)
VVGLVFALLSGVAPLLLPNPIFPNVVRWAHLCEVSSENFVLAAVVVWLWTSQARNEVQVSVAA